MRAAITMLDLGYDYSREIGQLRKLGVDAKFLPLEGTDDVKAIGVALSGCDFVLAGPELWSDEAFEAVGGQLKLVARLGVGVDKIDIAAATRRGIAICNAPGGNACSVAQHALVLMLDLSMGVSRYDQMVRNGILHKRTMAHDLMGKTVGLLGFGRISAQLTKLLSGFDCVILACDVYRNQELAASLGVRFVEIEELLADSDYISLHLPLTEHTKGMVNLQFLQRMKKNAYLINTARAEIVNESDLVHALKNGLIAGAGLDVFYNPLEGNELLSLDNVVLTPYVAFSSELGNRRTFDMAVGCIRDYLAGRPLENLLNPEYVRCISQ